ncbi:MAG: glycosyltransferase family 2 protein [Neomegalonema sp.]|nr:glycosyltransferase family 2 protein [Neomegalonema sp.]
MSQLAGHSATTTIIMPAYNSAAFIGEAIESVLAQTRTDWSLVVVNDGSADNTAEIVGSYDDPRITLITKANGGVAAARRTGIEASQSTFISLLDSDDKYTPDYLEVMIGKLERQPELAFCSCDATMFGECYVEGMLCSEAARMVPPVTLARVLSREFQVYTAASFRREWYDRIGGYDPVMRYSEDLDLWVRLLAAGGKAEFVNMPLAWYRGHPDSLTQRTAALCEGTIRVYEKMKQAAPDPQIQAICDAKIISESHQLWVDNAKKALKSNDLERFFEAAGKARNFGQNWKLALVEQSARVSPALTQRLIAWRLS